VAAPIEPQSPMPNEVIVALWWRHMSCRNLHWTGAGKIPARHFGYWQATIPLVKVLLIGKQLTVRIQPRWLGRLVGAQALEAVPAAGVEVRLNRNNATWHGIKFRPRHQPSSSGLAIDNRMLVVPAGHVIAAFGD
jgi:hypothetical protein